MNKTILYDWSDDEDYILYEEIMPEIEWYMDNHYGIIGGSIQRWDGSRDGYTSFDSYKDLFNFIEYCEIGQVFFDDDSLVLVCHHHDGTNIIHIKEMELGVVDYWKNNCDDFDYQMVEHFYKFHCLKPQINL